MTSLLAAIALAPLQAAPAAAQSAMVSSPEHNATQVGIEILQQGGNAYDAAAAVGFAIAVTYPAAGNIGGGGFAVGLTSEGDTFALDFREVAPAAATRDMFLDSSGRPMPGLSTTSHLAVGVPGSVDGLLKLQTKYGKLSRRQVLAPAIRLAQDGFEVRSSLTRSLGASAANLMRHEATKKVFFPNNQAVRAGTTLKQIELGDTLQRISDVGRDGFYQGPVAEALVAEMVKNKGLISHEDLSGYQAQWRDPIRVKADAVDVITMPLPSSGGITLGQVFGLVDWGKLRAAKQNSSEAIHHLTEALRLAFADRNEHLGDPSFVKVPVSELLSNRYLAERKKLMPEGRAGKSSEIKAGTPESMETTHYCVVDKDGNVCAITTTLNGSYGMGAVVPGGGFLLNNEMDDFTSKPGSPNMFGLVQSENNAIAPGKRMLSSMTPTIVQRDGKFYMTVGSPGGPTIITTVLQSFLNVYVWDMNIREAIDAPRFHHQHLPDNIRLERGISDATVAALKALGYEIDAQSSWGQAAGIKRETDGSLTGWFDSRGDGLAAGY